MKVVLESEWAYLGGGQFEDGVGSGFPILIIMEIITDVYKEGMIRKILSKRGGVGEKGGTNYLKFGKGGVCQKGGLRL